MGLFVAIAGNIGSGKTTLTKRLTDRFGWQPYFESVNNNPYLEDFYGDMKRHALSLQTYFLVHRFGAHQEIMNSENSAVQDRTIYEDYEIFTRNLFLYNNMSERDYMTYKSLFELMKTFLKPPDILVYLKADVKTLQERIKERGRAYEQGIPVDYLTQLNDRYNEWTESWKDSKVITVSIDGRDFKNCDSDFNYVCNEIISSLDQPELFIHEANDKLGEPLVFKEVPSSKTNGLKEINPFTGKAVDEAESIDIY